MDLNSLKNKLQIKNINKKRLSSAKSDWFSWGILISAILIAGFFLLSEVGYFLIETQANKQETERQNNLTEYYYNVSNETSTVHEVYEQARQALLNNDLEGVLATIHSSVMWKYEDDLRVAYQDGNLAKLVEPMTPLREKLYEDFTTVRYSVEPIPDNNNPNPLEKYGEEVEFMRNQKGIWKISSI